MTLFCVPAVLLCLLAMVDPAAACFPLFLPKTLALPSFHCFSHLFHCYCLIVFAQDLGTVILSLFFSPVSLLLLDYFIPRHLALLSLRCFSLMKAFCPQILLTVYVLRSLFIQEHGTVICSLFLLFFPISLLLLSFPMFSKNSFLG